MFSKNLLPKAMHFLFTSAIIGVLLDSALNLPSWAMDDNSAVSNTAITKSLVFLNNDQDNLDFLFRENKANVQVLEESKKLPEEDKKFLSQLEPHKNQTPQEAFIGMLVGILRTEIYDPILYDLKSEHATALKMGELRDTEKHFESRALTVKESLIYQRQKIPTRSVVEDIVIGAQQIDHLQLINGPSPVLFLGRTPCFLQVAYEEICRFYHPSRLTIPHIFHLSFSGTPDVHNIREGDFFQDNIATEARNLVTPEKLKFYCEYMDHQKMNTIGTKVYLVDMITTGSSLNSFLRVMRYYYETFLSREMPDVHFISVNLPYEIKFKSEAFTFDPGKREVVFNSLPKFGLCPLKLKTTPLHVNYGTIDYFLDNDNIQAYAVHGIEFPAQKWRTESLAELNCGGELHKIAYESVRPLMQKVIKDHDRLCREIASKILD